MRVLRRVSLVGAVLGIVLGLSAALAASPLPTPTPPSSPHRVFIPAVGAPAPVAPSPGGLRLWESPWPFLALGVAMGAWLALRALERGRRSR